MSLLWVEGFEGFNNASNLTTELQKKYATNSGLDANNDKVTGRFGGNAAAGGSSAGHSQVVSPTFTAGDTFFIGVAFKLNGTAFIPVTSGHPIVALWHNSSVQLFFNIFNNHELRVIDGGGTTRSSFKGIFEWFRWYYMELKVVISNTGSIQLKVDGVDKGTVSSIDTDFLNNGLANRLAIRFSSVGSNSIRTHLDDIYVCDDAGSINNDFLGDTYIKGSFPDADTADADFTPSAGSDNYAMIDEPEADGDTTYVEASVNGNRDLYDFANQSDLLTIHGLQVNTECKQSASEALITPIDSNGTVSTDSAQSVASSYANRYRIQETDPDTGIKFTQSGFNAATIGVEVSV